MIMHRGIICSYARGIRIFMQNDRPGYMQICGNIYFFHPYKVECTYFQEFKESIFTYQRLILLIRIKGSYRYIHSNLNNVNNFFFFFTFLYKTLKCAKMPHPFLREFATRWGLKTLPKILHKCREKYSPKAGREPSATPVSRKELY